jgi:hypothetical protein
MLAHIEKAMTIPSDSDIKELPEQYGMPGQRYFSNFLIPWQSAQAWCRSPS